MAHVWLTKKMLLEALRMTEGLPQSTFVYFKGSSEIKGNTEQTIMEITVPAKPANCNKKTIREDFHKLMISNGMEP